MTKIILKFLRDETGATTIEYGLIAAGIAIAIIASVNGVGASLTSLFGKVTSGLTPP